MPQLCLNFRETLSIIVRCKGKRRTDPMPPIPISSHDPHASSLLKEKKTRPLISHVDHRHARNFRQLAPSQNSPSVSSSQNRSDAAASALPPCPSSTPPPHRAATPLPTAQPSPIYVVTCAFTWFKPCIGAAPSRGVIVEASLAAAGRRSRGYTPHEAAGRRDDRM
jgi:hypothetical protein